MLLALACVHFASACSLLKPRRERDPDAIARHQQERVSWEKKAQSVRPGMLRSEVERILPEADFGDDSWDGVAYVSTYRTDGIVEWYYLSAHFICEARYSYAERTGDELNEVQIEAKERIQAVPNIVQVRRPRRGR